MKRHTQTAILEESPGMSCVDVAKEAGARWKTLSEEEKQPYTDLAGADKQRHDAEVIDLTFVDPHKLWC